MTSKTICQPYEIVIKDWNYSYTFSTHPEYKKWDQYNRFDNLEITGVLENSNLKTSKKASITLSGIDAEELKPKYRQEQTFEVSAISKTTKTLHITTLPSQEAI